MSYSLTEYILYINFRLVALIFCVLPLRIALFIGKTLGFFTYWFDSRHTRVAYGNLRIALAEEYSIPQLKAMVKKNYQNFGMNLVEILRIPKVNKEYINRYININGISDIYCIKGFLKYIHLRQNLSKRN